MTDRDGRNGDGPARSTPSSLRAIFVEPRSECCQRPATATESTSIPASEWTTSDFTKEREGTSSEKDPGNDDVQRLPLPSGVIRSRKGGRGGITVLGIASIPMTLTKSGALVRPSLDHSPPYILRCTDLLQDSGATAYE